MLILDNKLLAEASLSDFCKIITMRFCCLSLWIVSASCSEFNETPSAIWNRETFWIGLIYSWTHLWTVVLLGLVRTWFVFHHIVSHQILTFFNYRGIKAVLKIETASVVIPADLQAGLFTCDWTAGDFDRQNLSASVRYSNSILSIYLSV